MFWYILMHCWKTIKITTWSHTFFLHLTPRLDISLCVHLECLFLTEGGKNKRQNVLKTVDSSKHLNTVKTDLKLCIIERRCKMMKKSDFWDFLTWAACSLTNEKIIDFDSHEVHKDSNLAPLHLRSNISPCKTEKNFLENSFIRKLCWTHCWTM